MATDSDSKGTEHRAVSPRDTAGIQTDDWSGITGGCFLQPVIHLSNLNGEIVK
jgi:hypothetical protein